MNKWFRNLLKGASLTTALFIFQACYGMPQGIYDEREFYLTLEVVDGVTKAPVSGVTVKSLTDGSGQWYEEGVTDADGQIVVPVSYACDKVQLKFSDADGKYTAKDTTIVEFSEPIARIPLYK